MAVLELHLTVAAGREPDAAREVWAKVGPQHRAILAALAAEWVSIHEARTGSTVVVVTGSAQAERVLRDLQRDAPPALDPKV
jgi:hypothetical protein